MKHLMLFYDEFVLEDANDARHWSNCCVNPGCGMFCHPLVGVNLMLGNKGLLGICAWVYK